jgi:hypothetical protein
MRASDDNMDSLISSIREQANRLKKNLNEGVRNTPPPKNARSKSLAKSDFNFLNEERPKGDAGSIFQLAPEASPVRKNEEDLLEDNLNLLEMIRDF